MLDIRNLFGDAKEMAEFVEFVEAYKAFKAMQSMGVESARTTATAVNTIDKVYDEGRFVQVGNDIKDIGTASRDVKTKYEIVKCDDGYRIKHNIITRGKKYIDKKTGEEKQYRFNKIPVMLANNAIKALNEHPDFKGQLIEYTIPFENGSNRTYKGWGFKTKKMCEKALEVLPKVISGDEIAKVERERKVR